VGWPGDIEDPPSGNWRSSLLALGLFIVAVGVLLLLPVFPAPLARTVALEMILGGACLTVVAIAVILRFLGES